MFAKNDTIYKIKLSFKFKFKGNDPPTHLVDWCVCAVNGLEPLIATSDCKSEESERSAWPNWEKKCVFLQC